MSQVTLQQDIRLIRIFCFGLPGGGSFQVLSENVKINNTLADIISGHAQK